MKKINLKNLKKATLAGIAAAAMCGASQAHAQLVNFDVPGGARGTNYSGAAGTGSAGDDWNAIVTSGMTSSAVYAGGGASTVTLTESGGGNYGATGGSGVLALTSPFYTENNGGSISLTLGGVADGTYNLFLYDSNGVNANRGGTFTVDGNNLSTVNSTSGNGQSSAFILGQNYVEFTDLSVTTGSISISLAANPVITPGQTDYTGANNEADFNGLQLQSAVSTPEPSTWASMLLGLGFLGLVMRQRARKLQS
jgi:hypothetical protein